MPVGQGSWIPKIEAYLSARGRNLAEKEGEDPTSIEGLCKGLTLSLFEYIYYDVIVPYYEWGPVGYELTLEKTIENFFEEIEKIINTSDEDISKQDEIPYFERFITRLFFFQKLTQHNSYGLQLNLCESFQQVQNKNCKWILPQLEKKQTIITKIKNLALHLEQWLPPRRLVCLSFPKHATFLMNTGKNYIYYDPNITEKNFIHCRNKYELLVTIFLTDALLRNEHQKFKYDFDKVQDDFYTYYKSIIENEDSTELELTSKIREWLGNTPGGGAIQIAYLRQSLIKMKEFNLNECRFELKPEDGSIKNESGVAYLSFKDGCLYYQVMDKATQRIYEDEIYDDELDPIIFKLFQESVETKDLSKLNDEAKLALNKLIIQNQFFTECADINLYIPNFINLSLEYYRHPEEKKYIYPNLTVFITENHNIIELLSYKDHSDITFLERIILLGDTEGLKDWLKLLKDAKISDKENNNILNAIGGQGCTLLSLAISLNQMDMVKVLLDAHVDCNKPSQDSIYPLDIAFYQKNDALTVLLLQHGANLDVKNKFGVSFIVRFLESKNNDYFYSLLEEGIDVNSKYLTNTLLGYTVRLKKFSMMKHLLSLGADPNLCVKGRKTPLHQAILNESFNFIWSLLQAGALLNLEILNDRLISKEIRQKFEILLTNPELFKESNLAKQVGLLFKIPLHRGWSLSEENETSLRISKFLSSPDHIDDSPEQIAEFLRKQTRNLKMSASFMKRIKFVQEVLLPSQILEMQPIKFQARPGNFN